MEQIYVQFWAFFDGPKIYQNPDAVKLGNWFVTSTYYESWQFPFFAWKISYLVLYYVKFKSIGTMDFI